MFILPSPSFVLYELCESEKFLQLGGVGGGWGGRFEIPTSHNEPIYSQFSVTVCIVFCPPFSIFSQTLCFTQNHTFHDQYEGDNKYE